MESKTLPASSLPLLSGTIKDAINFGIWFLYEIEYAKNPSAKYSLSTSKGEFLLTQEGDIIAQILDNPEDVKHQSKITFSGIPSAPVVNMPSL